MFSNESSSPLLRLNPGHTELMMHALGGEKFKEFQDVKEDLDTPEYSFRRVRSPHSLNHGVELVHTEMFFTPDQVVNMFNGKLEDKLRAKAVLLDSMYEQVGNIASSLKANVEFIVSSFDFQRQRGNLEKHISDIQKRTANMNEQLDLVLSIAEQATAIYNAVYEVAQKEFIEYEELAERRKKDPSLPLQRGPHAEYVWSYEHLVITVEIAQKYFKIANEVLKSRLVKERNTLPENEKDEEIERLEKLLKEVSGSYPQSPQH